MPRNSKSAGQGARTKTQTNNIRSVDRGATAVKALWTRWRNFRELQLSGLLAVWIESREGRRA